MDYRLIFLSLVRIVMTWGVTVMDNIYRAVNVLSKHQRSLSRQIHSGVYQRCDSTDEASAKSVKCDFSTLEKLRKQRRTKSYR
jgi:hypothetical protein